MAALPSIKGSTSDATSIRSGRGHILAEPGAIPAPYILPRSSNVRLFSRLRIQIYGSTQMDLPEESNSPRTAHADHGWIPIASAEFRTDIL